jgi:hypothetical protein
MAHFAKLGENNIVEQVIVISNQDILDENGNENELIGVKFCQSLFNDNGKWKQTSYNNKFRGKFAFSGYTYDETLDVFIPPKPYPSWTYNQEKNEWNAPIPPPITEEENEQILEYIDNNNSVRETSVDMIVLMFRKYLWDEENQSWISANLNEKSNL